MMQRKRRGRNEGAAIVGFIDYNGTPRVRSAQSLRILPCPDCPAEAGEPCVNYKTGAPVNQVHTSRRRIALRKYREDAQPKPTKPVPSIPDIPQEGETK